MLEKNQQQKVPKIRRIDIFRVFLRSFFVQSVWNYRSLISAGFGICLIPIVNRLYEDPKAKKAFLNRHLKFFNAHPYMASYALGVSIKLEEDFAAGDAEASQKLERLKKMLVSILGAVGDKLFWSVIKPFSLMVGVLLLYTFQSIPLKIAALFATFLFCNIPHVYLRYKGIWEGYEYGLDVYKRLRNERFKKLETIYLMLGFPAFTLFIITLLISLFTSNIHQFVVFVFAVGSVYIIRKFTNNFYFTVVVAFFASLVVSYAISSLL